MANTGQEALGASDAAAVDIMRKTFGDAEAAKLWADLYKLKRTPPSGGSLLATFPRGIIILIALWVGLLETADKLPQLLLAYPRYQATLAETQAKMMQPALTTAQLEKAQFEAKASAFQPAAAETQLDKSKLETKAASFQPALVAAQAFKAEVEATANGSGSMDMSSVIRLDNMFDLLDPNHPNMVSRGISEPNVVPLFPFVKAKKESKASPPASPPEPEASTPAVPAAPAATAPPGKSGSVDPAPAAPPFKSATAEAPPAPLRTPTMLDCAKQSMGADFVICASPELMDAEARLEDAYRPVRAARGDAAKNEQVDWMKRYGPDCGLPLRGRPQEGQIQGATGCIRMAIENRIRALQAEQ